MKYSAKYRHKERRNSLKIAKIHRRNKLRQKKKAERHLFKLLKELWYKYKRALRRRKRLRHRYLNNLTHIVYFPDGQKLRIKAKNEVQVRERLFTDHNITCILSCDKFKEFNENHELFAQPIIKYSDFDVNKVVSKEMLDCAQTDFTTESIFEDIEKSRTFTSDNFYDSFNLVNCLYAVKRSNGEWKYARMQGFDYYQYSLRGGLKFIVEIINEEEFLEKIFPVNDEEPLKIIRWYGHLQV